MATIEATALSIEIGETVDTPVFWGGNYHRAELPAGSVRGICTQHMYLTIDGSPAGSIRVGDLEGFTRIARAVQRGRTVTLHGLSTVANVFPVPNQMGQEVMGMSALLLAAVTRAGLPAIASIDDDYSQLDADAEVRELRAAWALDPKLSRVPWTDDLVERATHHMRVILHGFTPAYMAWLRAATGVVVTTEALAEFARTVNPTVWVIPIGVDPAKQEYPARQISGSAHLGMAGGPGKFANHYPAILPAVLDAAREPDVHLHAFGGFPGMAPGNGLRQPGVYALEGIPCQFHPSPANIVAYFRSLQVLDIAALPLDASEATRSRSARTWLEMSLHETACCLQRSEPYELAGEGVTCLKADSVEEWRYNLIRLARDGELRLRLGRAAREEALARHTMEQRRPLWEECVAEARRLSSTAS